MNDTRGLVRLLEVSFAVWRHKDAQTCRVYLRAVTTMQCHITKSYKISRMLKVKKIGDTMIKGALWVDQRYWLSALNDHSHHNFLKTINSCLNFLLSMQFLGTLILDYQVYCFVLILKTIFLMFENINISNSKKTEVGVKDY